MLDQSAIIGMLDSLDQDQGGSEALRLPDGAEGSRVLDALVDAAEARIMADLSKAVRTTKALVDLAETHGTSLSRARARRVHGQALTYANRFAEAISVLSDAMPHAAAAGNSTEGGRIRLTMLHIHARQSRFDEAAECGKRALEDFRAAGESVLAGRAQNNLGIIERMRDRPAEAIGHFVLAEEALAPYPPLLAHVRNNLAEAYLDLDRFGDAESAFRRALDAFREAGASRHAGIVLGNLADLSSRQGRLHEALALFEEARRILGEAAAPGDAARLAIEHAEVLLTLGELERASESLREAIPTLESHSMAAEVARGKLAMGRVLARLGDSAATGWLSAAADGFAALSNATGRARALAQIASVASAAGDHEHAISILTEARAAVSDRPATTAWIDLLTAQSELQNANALRAATLSDAAASRAEEMGVLPLAADLLQTAGRAWTKLGSSAEAAGRFRQAVRLSERSRGVLQADRFRTAFVADRTTIWEDCASAVLDDQAPGALDEAFSLIESVRSRGLLGVIAGGAKPGENQGPEEVIAELSRIGTELESLYSRAQELVESAESRERVLAAIRLRESAAERLSIRLESTSDFGGYLAAPISLEQARAGVPEDGGLVVFFTELDRLSAIVITRRDVRMSRRFETTAAVRAQLEAFQFQVGRALARGLPGGERGRALVRDAELELSTLSRMLMEPLRLDSNRLAVVPTGVLHAVPFSALEMNGRQLLDTGALGVVPSASVLSRLPLQSGGGALVVGCADAAAPRAEQEAHDVAVSLSEATIVTGAAATRRAFCEHSAGRGLVHFAGHARFVSGNPSASGLRLADGWLTAAEIARLRWPGAAVVLSGCDTGRASVVGGDEAMGLSRAVLAAGATSVTTSLWPVHDQSASNMMASAYRHVYAAMVPSSGNSPKWADGLRRAQKEMRAQGAHAAAWAPFITVCCPWNQ